MNGLAGKCCANCTSFDAAEGCWNAVSFIDRASGKHRNAMADDCGHDHERKPAQLRIVRGGDHDMQ
ncbi:hypothetical protein [Burkholderia pseudomallei]|uniref:hypothetical protein n=1 Tax=Burkholderia pseudomallei TaxID=28450 RepID=UPI0011C23E41|nr:hypothetical protein [Burkholderia pseudomallei]